MPAYFIFHFVASQSRCTIYKEKIVCSCLRIIKFIHQNLFHHSKYLERVKANITDGLRDLASSSVLWGPDYISHNPFLPRKQRVIKNMAE